MKIHVRRSAWLIVLLALVLACGSAAGEKPIRTLDFSDRDYLLPIDDSAGMPLAEENYISENEYRDSTISVKVGEGRWRDACDYWYADIEIKDPSQLRSAVCGGSVMGVLTKDGARFGRLVNAVVAMNGDFPAADEKDGYGYTIRMGSLYQDNLQPEGRWNFKRMDILAVDEDADFHIIHQPGPGEMDMVIDGKRIVNTWVFGPGLVENGKAVQDFNLSDTWLPMASEVGKQRIALCQVGPLKYKIVCCAPPFIPNTGLTLREFADMLEEMGVETAYNLDGGDSTILFFHGEKVNFKDSETHRQIRDIIYFASAEGMEDSAEGQ